MSQDSLANGGEADSSWGCLGDAQAAGAVAEAENVYAAALRYVAAGLSVIPIAADGSKSPDWRRLQRRWDEHEHRYKRTWNVYRTRRPQPGELDGWAAQLGAYGLAVLGGVVSGGGPGLGLEIIDIDNCALAAPWIELVEQQAPGLLGQLASVWSPRPGLHVYYRCSAYGGNQKLACNPEAGEDGQPVVDAKNKPKKKTLIEIKGEGGYCVVPPSPASCHRSGMPYLLAEGGPSLTEVPVIAPEERAILLAAARTFNRWFEPAKPARSARVGPVQAGEGRPGDDFNVRGDWEEILCPHGWELISFSGDVAYWRRPGKDSGSSATTGYCSATDDGADLLYVFSTNASPFEEGKGYSKFRAYALLSHDGNLSHAAQELRRLGYGGGAAHATQRATN